MAKCKTCGKRLKQNESKYCQTCFEFHLYNYPKKKREEVLREYERSDQ